MAAEDRALLEAFLERLKAQAPLLARYRENPALFFTERGVRLFGELERLFQDVYSLKTRRAVALAPRGGGKTFCAAMLASAFFLFRDFDVGIVAGSETQALALFSYITEWLKMPASQETIETIKRSDILGAAGNRIVARTASSRSIRGLHIGRGRRGALLIIDEEAEAEEDVVRAARYIIRTAEPSVILRASTYHKLSGSFANLVENHLAQGYELYRWSSFDIAQPCSYSCELCPVTEFRTLYCKGKSRDSAGWLRVSEIASEWKESSRETFEIEVMGMKPASAGLVIAPEALNAAVTMQSQGFSKEACWAGVDWGFSGMTAVVVIALSGNCVHVTHTEAFERQGIEAIVTRLKQLRERFNLREVFPDSSHPFENSRLRDEGFAVWGASQDSSSTLGVPFSVFKEEGVSILSWLFEKGRIRIPESSTTLLGQLRSWRRDACGHIIKKNDHFPDALVAAMMKLKIMGVGQKHKTYPVTSGSRFFKP